MQLDAQHPGHGYLEAFTKPALESLPAGAEITQPVAPSAEKEQVAASVVSADETETGETVPLPGSSRHAPCTLEFLLYDDTVRACVKKQQNQSESLDKTFADLPTILEEYEGGRRPVLKTDLDRAAAGRVWTLDDLVVYKRTSTNNLQKYIFYDIHVSKTTILHIQRMHFRVLLSYVTPALHRPRSRANAS